MTDTRRLSNDFTETDHTGFPSHLIPMERKDTQKWCMSYAKAFNNEHKTGLGSSLFRRSAKQYRDWRELMRGRQDIDQYKPQLGIKKGRHNRSWKAIDWSVLPIAPKFKELLIGKLMNTTFNLSIEAIDKNSEEEKREFTNRLKENVINKDLIEGVSASTGIQFEDALTNQGVPMPDTIEEAETVADMFYKDEYAMELKDAMDLVFDVSDLNEHRREMIEDLVEVGVGGMREWTDKNGMPKFRRVVPERTVINNCRYNDFRDVIRVGEYLEMTIADLKSMAGDAFTEKEYRDIAQQSGKKQFGAPYDVANSYQDLQHYPYDKEKITVLDATWLSVDSLTHVEKPNSFGNRRLKRKNSNFLFNKEQNRTISDEEYKERYPDREVLRTPIRNVYRCMWIVDTEYAWDFGLATNMIREAKDLRETQLPYTLYTTGFDSLARLIEPVIHNCQLNWLQYQNHIARSRPSGLAIEMSALENITLGANQKRMPPKEVLRMYMDTGTLLWRRKNWNNASNQWKPIEELANGISPAAAQHFQNIMGNIDLLRIILGINEVEDASTPNPNILKGVAEIASMGTNNALHFLFHGERSILTRMSKKLALMIPDGRKISKHKGFEDALGKKSDEFWKNLESREFGIVIDDGPTLEEKQRLSQYIQASLKAGFIMPDEAFQIERENNLIRAAQLLRDKRKQREREQQESQQAGYQAEQEKNINSTNAAAQAEAQKLEVEFGLKGQHTQIQGQVDMMVNQAKAMNEILIEKVRRGTSLSEEESKRVTDLMKINQEYKWKMIMEGMKPPPSINSVKSQKI
jgi:hypothetical protein